MLSIPGGRIELKNEATQQKWIVELKPFLMASSPVTQRDFNVVSQSVDLDSSSPNADTPAVNVSWIEAVTFCNDLSLRAGFTPCYAELSGACRASCRRKSHPTLAIDDLGFRLVRSLEPSEL